MVLSLQLHTNFISGIMKVVTKTAFRYVKMIEIPAIFRISRLCVTFWMQLLLMIVVKHEKKKNFYAFRFLLFRVVIFIFQWIVSEQRNNFSVSSVRFLQMTWCWNSKLYSESPLTNNHEIKNSNENFRGTDSSPFSHIWCLKNPRDLQTKCYLPLVTSSSR